MLATKFNGDSLSNGKLRYVLFARFDLILSLSFDLLAVATHLIMKSQPNSI